MCHYHLIKHVQMKDCCPTIYIYIYIYIRAHTHTHSHTHTHTFIYIYIYIYIYICMYVCIENPGNGEKCNQ